MVIKWLHNNMVIVLYKELLGVYLSQCELLPSKVKVPETVSQFMTVETLDIPMTVELTSVHYKCADFTLLQYFNVLDLMCFSYLQAATGFHSFPYNMKINLQSLNFS